jgi:hypothetical protein
VRSTADRPGVGEYWPAAEFGEGKDELFAFKFVPSYNNYSTIRALQHLEEASHGRWMNPLMAYNLVPW